MNSIKKEPARVRPQQIKFWVTEEEKQRIEKRAARFQSTAAYLREIALKGKIIERPPSITLNHYLELNRIGNNINQLTRQVNSGEANIFHRKTKRELEEILIKLSVLIEENRAEIKELSNLK
jgi:succinylglutamate desuccinylase